MKKATVFTGSAVAIVTPFNNDGIDYEALGRLLDFQLANKTDAIVICGTTGEASTMTDDEHVDAIRYTVSHINGRIPVIAGTGSNDTKYAAELSVIAEELGADAILTVAPYYNKTTQQGLVVHFTAIAKAVSIPVILYNVPSRTNLNISPQTIVELSKIDNIVAVKECNFTQVADYITEVAEDFTVYSGDDILALPYMAYGSKGVISVAANIVPGDIHNLIASCLEGDYTKARGLQLKLHPLCQALFCEVSPIPLKAAMNILGMKVGECRLPLVPISAAGREQLMTALRNYSLLS